MVCAFEEDKASLNEGTLNLRIISEQTPYQSA